NQQRIGLGGAVPAAWHTPGTIYTSGMIMALGSIYAGGGGVVFNSGPNQGLSWASGAQIADDGTGYNLLIKAGTASTTIARVYPTGMSIGGSTLSTGAVLDVQGSIVSRSVNNGAGTTISFTTGNTQYTSTACSGTTWALSNMVDGGTYTINVKNNTHTGTCAFSHTGITNWFFRPANATPGTGHVIYSLQRIGNDVYISWIDGFQ
ncbi:MAG: hypothetical protein V4760_07760, partial [Bdellovibrionota bacterium]